MTSPYDDLIKRLEEATGPSRELDAQIWCIVKGYELDEVFSNKSFGVRDTGNGEEWIELFYNVPDFTTSLDAIIGLIVGTFDDLHSLSIKRLSKDYLVSFDAEQTALVHGSHKHWIVAICIAYIKALSARDSALRAREAAQHG